MVYSSGINNSICFLEFGMVKNGRTRSMRALNSNFNERSPSYANKRGNFLFFVVIELEDKVVMIFGSLNGTAQVHARP